MTFEEEFPSFKNHPDALSHHYRFSANDIRRLCIDKQRIRKAITKIMLEWDADGEKIGWSQDILQELGL